MAQGKVDVEGLTVPALIFTIDVMSVVMDNLIQDNMQLDESGMPLPYSEQEDSDVRRAMEILNYK